MKTVKNDLDKNLTTESTVYVDVYAVTKIII